MADGEISALVIDNGSGMVKAGFAGALLLRGACCPRAFRCRSS